MYSPSNRSSARRDPLATLLQLEANLLRAFPERFAAERIEVLEARRQCDEMIARQLADLRGEAHAAIGEQNLGLADAAGIENDLARRGIAGVVLVAHLEVIVAERNPNALAAPSNVDHLALERHSREEGFASLRRQRRLEAGAENEGTRGNL